MWRIYFVRFCFCFSSMQLYVIFAKFQYVCHKKICLYSSGTHINIENSSTLMEIYQGFIKTQDETCLIKHGLRENERRTDIMWDEIIHVCFLFSRFANCFHMLMANNELTSVTNPCSLCCLQRKSFVWSAFCCAHQIYHFRNMEWALTLISTTYIHRANEHTLLLLSVGCIRLGVCRLDKIDISLCTGKCN